MKNHLSPEEWRSVAASPAYQVSEFGDIRSAISNARRPRLAWHQNGYVRVRLAAGGIGKEYLVHRLVCEAFHGIPLVRRRVLHLDSDLTNNASFNLAWGSPVRGHKRVLR